MNLVDISQEFDKLPQEQRLAILSIIEQKTENNMKDFLNAVEALGLKITALQTDLQSFKTETQVSIKELNSRLDATNKEISTRFDLFYRVLAFIGALIGLGLTLFALFKG